MRRQVYKNGKWSKTKPSPEQLPKHMARLPSELVTKEIADDKKVHELDEFHIVAGLEKDYADKVNADGKEKPKPVGIAPAHNPDKRLSQFTVDLVILRILRQMVNTQQMFIQLGKPLDIRPRHIWFTHDDINSYESRRGNAPADVDRPKHLKGYNLVLDVTVLPETLQKEIRTIEAKREAEEFAAGASLDAERERTVTSQ